MFKVHACYLSDFHFSLILKVAIRFCCNFFLYHNNIYFIKKWKIILKVSTGYLLVSLNMSIQCLFIPYLQNLKEMILELYTFCPQQHIVDICCKMFNLFNGCGILLYKQVIPVCFGWLDSLPSTFSLLWLHWDEHPYM